MALFLDVDAVAKLSHWEILPHLPSLTGMAWTECGTLSSLKFRALRGISKPDGKLFRTQAAAQIASDAIAQMGQTVPLEPSTSDLQDLAGIDPGEMILLEALTGAGENSRLLTGDKRALKALATLGEKHRQRYSGRVLIVEQIIAKALHVYDLPWLQARVCPQRQIDTAISIVFGSRCDASEPSVKDGLKSYCDEMHCLCDPSLLDRSFS